MKNNAEKNFFFVNRELLYSSRWLSEKFTRAQAWVDLFGLAQHTDNFFFVRGIKVEVKRGQLAYSQLTLANRWKWSRDKVRRYLKCLESDGDIIQQNNEITTLITIVKYNVWQGNNTTDNTTEKQQKNIKQDTYNKDNKNNNDNKEIENTHTFKEPDILEVKEYCKERNNSVNPQRFIDFYKSKGWMVGKNKMKDWKACIRTWEDKEKPKDSLKINTGKYDNIKRIVIDNTKI